MKNLIYLSLVLIAGLAMLVSGGFTMSGLKIGDKAPDFTLKNVDGKFYSLKNIRDAQGKTPKGYIVTFTCNTCPFAKMYEDRLIDLHKKMSAKGWPVVAIQPNDPEIMPGDSFEAMKQRASEKRFPYVYLLDEEQTVFPAYGAQRTPHVFLLDKNLIVHYIGAVDDNAQDASSVKHNYVVEAIEALEAGREVEIKTTKAIGCAIKAK